MNDIVDYSTQLPKIVHNLNQGEESGTSDIIDKSADRFT